MLSTWEAINTRRSVRKFDPNKHVSDDILKQMLDAARLAPSGTNMQPWRFIVVRGKESWDRLCGMSVHKWMSRTTAPVMIFCFADLDTYSVDSRKKHYEALADELRSENVEPPPGMLSANTQPREQVLRGAQANTFIAIEHLLLMGAALGVGTCWLGATDNPKFNAWFNLPNNYVSIAVVAVGYPLDGKLPPQHSRLSLDEILLQPLPK